MIKKIKIENESKIEETVNPYLESGYKIVNIFPYPDGDKQIIVAILEKSDVITG